MKRLALIGLSMFVKAVLNFAALIVFARILAPAEYGVYSLVLTMVLLADSFAFLWLRSSYTRFFAETDTTRHRTNVSHILFLYMALAAACVLVAAIGGMFFYPIQGLAPWLWLVVGGMMVGEGLFNLQLVHANNGRKEIRFLAISAIKALSALGLGWLLALNGYGVAGILCAQLLAYILSGLLLIRARHRIREFVIWKPDPTTIKFLLVFGMPLAVMGVLENIITSAHRNMVFHMLGPEALGTYAVSYDLVQKVLVFIMLTLNTAMLPMVVKALESSGPDAAREKLKQNAIVYAGLGIPAAVGMTLFAPQICAVFLGSQYVNTASILLPWFVIAALAKCAVSFYLVQAFYLTKTNRKLILPMLAITALSIGACCLGIRTLGMFGALAAAIVTWVVYAILVWYLGRKQFPLPAPWKDWALIALASGIMGLGVYPFTGVPGLKGLLIAAILGGTLYLASIILLDVDSSRAKALTAFRKKLRR